jgi:hypothetical protein
METLLLLSAVVLLPLALILILWIFRPAITSCQNAAQPKKTNIFCDINGVIEADNQIHEHAKCDISLVVPAYNEVVNSM